LGERDYTKRSLQRSNGVDENFLSDVIHKIKNGLGGIGGFAALLERDLETNDPRQRLVHRIQDGVNKVNEVVVNLMTLVRDIEPSFKKVKLQSLLKEMLKDSWEGEKSIPEISYHPNLKDVKVELWGDPQVIRKILSHAIRFTDLVKGKIEVIRVSPHTKKKVNVEFCFLNGTLPKDTSQNIVKLMNDCQPIEARLLLAIVLKMVTLHGGRVSIISYTKNQKALMIQLPRGNQRWA